MSLEIHLNVISKAVKNNVICIEGLLILFNIHTNLRFKLFIVFDVYSLVILLKFLYITDLKFKSRINLLLTCNFMRFKISSNETK